ncbi:hypothetical protein PQQ51_18500 [Paraburkholderia xenovorans]|uniref:hypothetical protein n=1 Tax=Paraburkholderia xenovorans TaxID=36873 RepID=UPI0038BA26F4
MQSVIRSLLRLRLALSRFGTGTLLAAALLAAAALLWLGVLPGMSARVADETRSVARLRAQPVPKPVVPAPVLAAGRLADFYAGLGDSAHTGEIVMRLFDAAAAAGVTLDKAEYKPGHDAPGRFDTYTIVLPVKGDYARLRQFSEKVLVTVPYAALDDMRFQRNSANDPGVEANLRFTAFLRPVTIAPVSASAVAAAAVNASAAAVAAASGASATAVATSGASGAAVAVAAAPGAPTRAAVTATASPEASMAAVTIAALPLAAPAVVVSAVPLPTTAATTAATLAHTSAAQLKSGLPQPHKPSPASAPASPATARSASAPSAATPQKIAASQGATR